MRAIVIANGKLYNPQTVLNTVQPDDFVVAANGGARYCKELNLKPDLVIGDFDSLNERDIDDFIQDGAEIITHPQRKDKTDLELALLHTKKLGVDEVLIFAALGDRWDMTLANVFLLTHTQLLDSHITLTDGHQEIRLLQENKEINLIGSPGDTVSLLPLTGDVHGVTTQGLEYPLDNGTLRFGTTRGMSNVMLEEIATIRVDKGLLLCFLIHRK